MLLIIEVDGIENGKICIIILFLSEKNGVKEFMKLNCISFSL